MELEQSNPGARLRWEGVAQILGPVIRLENASRKQRLLDEGVVIERDDRVAARQVGKATAGPIRNEVCKRLQSCGFYVHHIARVVAGDTKLSFFFRPDGACQRFENDAKQRLPRLLGTW